MALRRRSSDTTRIATRGEDLSKLTSEVLRLRLQTLNLPITGSKRQLLTRLNRASSGQSSRPKQRPGRHSQSIHPQANDTATQLPSTEAGGIDARQAQRLRIPEDSALSDRASLSSIKDMLSPMQRTIPYKAISLPTNETPSVRHSILQSRTLSPSLFTVL